MLQFFVLISGFFAIAFPPEQVHIAVGKTPNSFAIQWTTFDNPKVTSSQIHYGTSKSNLIFTQVSRNHTIEFIDSGHHAKQRTLHIVWIDKLSGSSTYFYKVGDATYGWSETFSFQTLDTTQPQIFAIFGDLGYANAMSVKQITEDIEHNLIDMVLHVGDIGYNLHEDDGDLGDDFFNTISPIAANVPYMVDAGNHEHYYNFSHYTFRFQNMPVSEQTIMTWNGRNNPVKMPNNWYYSFDYGLVHVVAIATEIFFDLPHMIDDQLTWLEQDLKKANQNRDKVPWIIVHGHRPLYCTSYASDCAYGAKSLRDPLEKLFHTYGVEFYICGHEHNYERLYDIYQNQTEQKTVDFQSTTYIVTGSGGCREHLSGFDMPMLPYCALRSETYGYGRMSVNNATHIYWEQILADNRTSTHNGKKIDETWFIKNSHGSFLNSNDRSFHSKVQGDSIRPETLGIDTNYYIGIHHHVNH